MTQVTHWAPTHDPCDPWPMGHRGRHPILAQALHRFIDYPALHLDIVYVHTPLSCYIIAHVGISKLHTQTPVNLEFWYIIIATIYISPAIEIKNRWVMGQHLVTHDPCDSSDFCDPFDPWPMTHRPIPCSGLLYNITLQCWTWKQLIVIGN